MSKYKSGMDYEGIEEGYHVYKNSAGFMEGFKKIGKNKYGNSNQGSDIKRVVSNQTTLAGFGKYVRGLHKKVKTKDIPLKTSQLPPLPFTD